VILPPLVFRDENYLKPFFSLKPDYMIYLVAMNLVALIGLDILYLVAKIGQFRAFADYTVEVNQVN
jgi:hypothetical protein